VVEGDEGAGDDGDVHEVPEVAQVGAGVKHQPDVDHLKV